MPDDEPAEPNSLRSLEQTLAEIDAANTRGDRLRAFDIADISLLDFPDAVPIKRELVLALARAGATQQARARYRQLGLDQPIPPEAPAPLRINIAALDARIAKDAAMLASGATRIEVMRDAAQRYNVIFKATGDTYPGINAATLCYLAGDIEQAGQLATAVLAACAARPTSPRPSPRRVPIAPAQWEPGPGAEREGPAQREGEVGAWPADSASDALAIPGTSTTYFLHATEAEAHLLLGNHEAARTDLLAAAAQGANLSDLATTRKQLANVCAATGANPDILRALKVPTVIHFTGHQIGKRFPPEQEAGIAQRIAAALTEHNIGIGYGSLAGGADILIAEAILRAGGELNIVLPFEADEFRCISVAPSGPAWLARFDACLAAARSVEFATTDAFLGDTSLFGYGSHLAMGLALLRAAYLGGEARQLAVWDGAAANGEPGEHGTGADIRDWTARGHQTDIIAPDAATTAEQPAEPAPSAPAREETPARRRVVRAMLFGDIAGFSNLREAQLPVFLGTVLGRLAAILDRFDDAIEYRNSWGDGLFVVAREVETAASCALDLQQAMLDFDPAGHGLSGYGGLRLGAHVGPVFELYDPVLRRPTFLGVHVSRTARIEPVAPVGAVYVTEAFAANLAIRAGSPFHCEYVGQIPLAKNHGRMRMYSLRRR